MYFLKTAIIPLLSTAWKTNPAIAIHAVSRYQSLSVTTKVRQLLRESTEQAADSPEALSILLGSSLPGDVASQLKVGLMLDRIIWADLTILTVPIVLGSCKPHHSCHLLSPGISQSSLHRPVCCPCSGSTFRGRYVFLCASDCPSSAL